MTAMTLLLAAPVALPALAAAGHAALGWRRATAWFATVAAAGVLAAGADLALLTRHAAATGLDGLARCDPLSAYMLIVIGAVSLVATAAGPGYLAAEPPPPRLARRYGMLSQAFVAAMATTVLAASLGVAWVAIEATTVVTAFLVGFRHHRRATEAAWKYVVICSTGIALAFLGLVLLRFAALHGGVPAARALDWASLSAAGGGLDPQVARIAVALLMVGFAAKAGLVPLHAWLPDAHSQAPAPVSAMMSGVLLSVAFYVLLRVRLIAAAALGPAFPRTLLLILGLATLGLAASLLLAQQDYKRMLAYSSMEHMGLLAIGAAIGTQLALAAVLLHILGHGLAKSVAFVSSGHIQHTVGSSRMSAVRGLAARQPLLAGVFGAALLALLGFPPFSLFASELGIARAGFAAGLGWAVGAALALALVALAAIAASAGPMLLGAPPPATQAGAPVAQAAAARADAGEADGRRATATMAVGTRIALAEPRPPRLPRATAAPLIAALAVSAALGVSAWPLGSLLHSAASVAAVGRP